MNLNKVMLIGRLGKKPEVNYIQPDLPVAKFSLATSEYYKDKTGAKIENTEWHNIVAWRGNAKFAENYLNKGMLVYIEGKIQTRRWESQDGTARYVTEIVADILRILEKRENREFTQNSQTQNTEANSKSSFDESSKQESQDFMADDDVFGGDDLGNNDGLPF